MAFKDPEDKKAYDKAYYEANKEKIAKHKKAYREKKHEKIAEYQKAYNQTPAGKKSLTIGQWKYTGLIHDDYDTLYETYLQTTNCDVCKSTFKDTFDRCMDHDHSNGLFRQFLCRACNTRDSWLLKR